MQDYAHQSTDGQPIGKSQQPDLSTGAYFNPLFVQSFPEFQKSESTVYQFPILDEHEDLAEGHMISIEVTDIDVVQELIWKYPQNVEEIKIESLQNRGEICKLNQHYCFVGKVAVIDASSGINEEILDLVCRRILGKSAYGICRAIPGKNSGSVLDQFMMLPHSDYEVIRYHYWKLKSGKEQDPFEVDHDLLQKERGFAIISGHNIVYIDVTKDQKLRSHIKHVLEEKDVHGYNTHIFDPIVMLEHITNEQIKSTKLVLEQLEKRILNDLNWDDEKIKKYRLTIPDIIKMLQADQIEIAKALNKFQQKQETTSKENHGVLSRLLNKRNQILENQLKDAFIEVPFSFKTIEEIYNHIESRISHCNTLKESNRSLAGISVNQVESNHTKGLFTLGIVGVVGSVATFCATSLFLSDKAWPNLISGDTASNLLYALIGITLLSTLIFGRYVKKLTSSSSRKKDYPKNIQIRN